MPDRFNAGGWRTGSDPFAPDSGRWNALGSSFGAPPAATSGGGFWSNIGRGLGAVGGTVGGLIGRGIGLLPQFGGGMPSAPPSGGVTPSAGGWQIDANGNLIGSDAVGNTTRAGPRPMSHTTAIPGWAAAAMGETRRKNLL